MHRAGFFPIAGTVPQHTMFEGDGTFGGLDDVEEGDVGRRLGQTVPPVGSLLGNEQSLGHQSGQGQGQGLVGDTHLRRDLAGLAQSGPVVAGYRDHGTGGVVAGAFEFELHNRPDITSIAPPRFILDSSSSSMIYIEFW